jgi:hypothetical protein
MALFINPSLASSTRLSKSTFFSRLEVGHLHSESSMHFYFSPADCVKIIEMGWGERHVLTNRMGRIWSKVDSTMLMLYAPRDEEDLKVVKELIRCSCEWMSGEKVVI